MVIRKQHGFSLIEIMFTVSLVVLLTMMAAPFARAWVANARIADTENKLRQAYKKVVSLAIRNTSASSLTSASLVYSNTSNTLTIVNNGSTTWTAKYYSDISIVIGSCASQIDYDNNGFPINSGCSSYTISASGGTNATGTLP
jgi:prepilin-type N-terminal cleavage/methylation domain-containing protein